VYLDHWKLVRRPFESRNDLAFFFFSKTHQEALVRLLYGIGSGRSLSVLTGDYGTGKTFLMSKLKKDLQDFGHPIAWIAHPPSDPMDFLRQVSLELSGSAAGSGRLDWIFRITEATKEAAHQGLETVVLIDDGSFTQGEVFREVAHLASLEENGRALVHVMIAGAPTLRAELAARPFVSQRIELSSELSRLDFSEVVGYIEHRLRVAGSSRAIFADSALRRIFAYTGGVPRLINAICDLALLVGFMERAEAIEAPIVREAITEHAQFNPRAHVTGSGTDSALLSPEDPREPRSLGTDT